MPYIYTINVIQFSSFFQFFFFFPAAFMYDRSNQQQNTSLIRPEEDIAEEDEAFIDDNVSVALSDIDNAKLMSCLDEIRNVLGDSFPESELVKAVMDSEFDAAAALDKLLNSSTSGRNDKGTLLNAPYIFNIKKNSLLTGAA